MRSQLKTLYTWCTAIFLLLADGNGISNQVLGVVWRWSEEQHKNVYKFRDAQNRNKWRKASGMWNLNKPAKSCFTFVLWDSWTDMTYCLVRLITERENVQVDNLQTTIESSWDCNTFGRLCSACCHGSDEAVKFFSLFFQLFDKTVDCKLRKWLTFTTLRNHRITFSASPPYNQQSKRGQNQQLCQCTQNVTDNCDVTLLLIMPAVRQKSWENG